MTQKIAIIPGSFDPITLGHIDIINRTLQVFDSVVIAIGKNPKKNHMFTLKQRKKFITSIFKHEKKITTQDYVGLTVDLCTQQQANYIIRGIRNYTDFEYEKDIALTNHKLNNTIETIFFLANQEYSIISSSIVKDVIKHKGNLKPFLHHSTIYTINKI